MIVELPLSDVVCLWARNGALPAVVRFDLCGPIELPGRMRKVTVDLGVPRSQRCWRQPLRPGGARTS